VSDGRAAADLATAADDDALLTSAPTHGRAIAIYTAAIVVAPMLLWAAVTATELTRIPWGSWEMVSRYLSAVLLLLCELRPLLLARSDGETDGITVSAAGRISHQAS